MAAVKPALQEDSGIVNASTAASPNNVARLAEVAPRRLTQTTAASPGGIRPVAVPVGQPRRETSFQPRTPVITGEATYRGKFPVDGVISGQLGAAGSALTIKQRPKSGPAEPEPELDGEISFKDMLRINGHVAGKVFSFKGTLIVDASAKVEAEIDVGVCVVSGIVVGDIVGHERVEVGSGAVVKGNIATRTLSIKPGAVFQGDCRMLKDETVDQ
jgi:cytoskeletal protein CcmA (bactofilin family)